LHSAALQFTCYAPTSRREDGAAPELLLTAECGALRVSPHAFLPACNDTPPDVGTTAVPPAPPAPFLLASRLGVEGALPLLGESVFEDTATGTIQARCDAIPTVGSLALASSQMCPSHRRLSLALQVSVSALRLRHAADAADALYGAAAALRRPTPLLPPPPALAANGNVFFGAASLDGSATLKTPTAPLRRRRRVLWDVNVAVTDGITAEWCTHDGGAATSAIATHGEVSFGSGAGGSARGPAATPTAAASPFGSPFAATPAPPPPSPLRIVLHALRASVGGVPDVLALSQLAIIRANGEWTVEMSEGALETPSATLAPTSAAAWRAARIHGAVWSAWRRGSRGGAAAPAAAKPRGAVHVRLRACTMRTWADMHGTGSSSSSGAARCEALFSVAALRASLHPSRAARHASLEDASLLYRDPGRKDATAAAGGAASAPAPASSPSLAPPSPTEVLVFEANCLYLAAEPAAPFGRPPALDASRALRVGGEGVALRWDPDAHFLAQRIASEALSSHRAAAAAAAASSPCDAFGRLLPALDTQTAHRSDDAAAPKKTKAARGAASLSLDVAHFRAELLASSCLRASLTCDRVCGDSAPDALARGVDLAALSLGVNGARVLSASQLSVRPPPARASAAAEPAAAGKPPTPPVWTTPLQLTPEAGGDLVPPLPSAATLTASTPLPRLARTATAGRGLRRSASLERGRDGAAARAGCLLPEPRERATWRIDATSAALRMPHGLDLGASVAAFETFAKAFRAVGGAPFLPRRDGGGGAPSAPPTPSTPGGGGGSGDGGASFEPEALSPPPPLTELFLRLRGGVTLSAEDAPLERWLHARRRAAAAGAAAAAAAAAAADGSDAPRGSDGGAAATAAATAAFCNAIPGATSAAHSSVFCLAGTEADLLLVFGGGPAAAAAAATLAASVDGAGCDGVPLRVARAACLDLCITQPRLRFRDHATAVLAADSLCFSGPLVMARQAVPPPAAAAAAVPQRVGRRRAAHRAAPPPADAPTATLKLWSDLRLNASALTVCIAACASLHACAALVKTDLLICFPLCTPRRCTSRPRC
jgi:hypothetical protein